MALNHAHSGDVVDLNTIIDDTSIALTKHEDFEALCVHLPSGKTMQDHKVDGPIMVQCLSGHCLFYIDDNPKQLNPGSWLFLDGGVNHSIKAIDETVLLLTILFKDGRSS